MEDTQPNKRPRMDEESSTESSVNASGQNENSSRSENNSRKYFDRTNNSTAVKKVRLYTPLLNAAVTNRSWSELVSIGDLTSKELLVCPESTNPVSNIHMLYREYQFVRIKHIKLIFDNINFITVSTGSGVQVQNKWDLEMTMLANVTPPGNESDIKQGALQKWNAADNQKFEFDHDPHMMQWIETDQLFAQATQTGVPITYRALDLWLSDHSTNSSIPLEDIRAWTRNDTLYYRVPNYITDASVPHTTFLYMRLAIETTYECRNWITTIDLFDVPTSMDETKKLRELIKQLPSSDQKKFELPVVNYGTFTLFKPNEIDMDIEDFNNERYQAAKMEWINKISRLTNFAERLLNKHKRSLRSE